MSYCPKCGTKLRPNVKFCHHCGTETRANSGADIASQRVKDEEKLHQEKTILDNREEKSKKIDWCMLGCDPRHSNSDGTTLVPPLEEIWEFKTGAKVTGPIPANGMVFFGSKDKNLYALDADTGELKWRFKTGKKITRPPVVSNGIVYVVSRDDNIYAIDSLTGKKRWQFSTGKRIWSTPATVDGIVFFGSKDKKIYALDAKSGEVRWRFNSNCQVFSAPTIIDTKVLIIGREKRALNLKGDIYRLYALDTSNGALLWELKVKYLFLDPLNEDLFPLPTYVRIKGVRDCIFFPVNDSKGVDVIDLVNGHFVNYIVHDLPLRVYSLSAYDNFLYIVLEDGSNVIVRLFPVEVHFVAELKKLSSPVITKDFIFIAGSQFSTGLIGKLKGTLYGINFSRFTRRWEFDMPHGFDSCFSPAIANGMLFVSDEKGNIYAFRSRNSSLQKTLEITCEISDFPKFKATTIFSDVKFPTMCCLCCGKAEKRDTLNGTAGKQSLTLSGIPYCKNCYKRTHGVFGKNEKLGAELEGIYPLSISFRNEKYWTYFMEANKLR